MGVRGRYGTGWHSWQTFKKNDSTCKSARSARGNARALILISNLDFCDNLDTFRLIVHYSSLKSEETSFIWTWWILKNFSKRSLVGACFKHENSRSLIGAKGRSQIGSVKQIRKDLCYFSSCQSWFGSDFSPQPSSVSFHVWSMLLKCERAQGVFWSLYRKNLTHLVEKMKFRRFFVSMRFQAYMLVYIHLLYYYYKSLCFWHFRKKC